MSTIEIELTPEWKATLEALRSRFPGKTDEELITAAIRKGLEVVGFLPAAKQ